MTNFSRHNPPNAWDPDGIRNDAARFAILNTDRETLLSKIRSRMMHDASKNFRDGPMF
jgi:hypothetical protein